MRSLPDSGRYIQERPIVLACAEEIDEGELSDHQASGGQKQTALTCSQRRSPSFCNVACNAGGGRPAVDLNRQYREYERWPIFDLRLRSMDLRSIRQQIIVPAQNSLDVNRRTRGGIGICRTRCEHTERPVMFSVLCNAIDRYLLDVMTARLLSHF
jgi:hypothetical protein